MTLSTDQYNALLSRLTKLERTMNDLITATNKMVSLEQVNQIFTVLQQEGDALRVIVASLQTRVESLEDEPYDTPT